MKIKRNILTFLAVLCLSFAIFSVTAFANENEAMSQESDASESTYETARESIFDEIYGAVMANADKILSAMAFCGTLIVGFAYKRGLLPLLGKAMNAISKSVDGIKEDGIRSAQSTEERLTNIDASIKEIRESSAVTEASISDIEEHISRYDEAMAQDSAMKTVMSAQTDMLYAVFMSSALSQYQKEEIGERIAEMRKELKLNEGIN